MGFLGWSRHKHGRAQRRRGNLWSILMSGVDSGAGQAETNPPAKTETTPPFFTSAGGFWCVMRRSTIQFVGYEPRPSLGPGAQLGNPRAEPVIPVG